MRVWRWMAELARPGDGLQLTSLMALEVLDAIIAKLCRLKDAMARQHGVDVRALAASLRGKEQSRRAHPSKPTAGPTAATGVGRPS